MAECGVRRALRRGFIYIRMQFNARASGGGGGAGKEQQKKRARPLNVTVGRRHAEMWVDGSEGGRGVRNDWEFDMMGGWGCTGAVFLSA